MPGCCLLPVTLKSLLAGVWILHSVQNDIGLTQLDFIPSLSAALRINSAEESKTLISSHISGVAGCLSEGV